MPGESQVNGLTEKSTFEGGAAYRTADDIYWVLCLSGSWEEMGRQYGALVKDDLQAFYKEITEDIAQRGISQSEQLSTAKAFTATYPGELIDLMKGMAETSGLSKDELTLLDVGMVNLSGALLGEMPTSSCSGIAVWGDYTADGTLVFGRNWDIDRAGMEKYMKYLAVVVFNPDSGNSFASVHPLGNFYVETGMNEKGLFLELNNGVQSDNESHTDRENTAAVMATALNQCGTPEEAFELFNSIPADLSYIIQAADANGCISIERPTFGCRARAGSQDGLLVAYNSFISPYPDEWNGKIAEPPAYETDPRYENLVGTANSADYSGKLGVASMKTLMGLDVKHGGAVHNGTVVQVIAVPADLTLWIRGYDYSDWQQVSLSGLFR